MKLSKYLLAIAVLTLALTVSAKANLQFLGAQAFGPNNNPDTNHDVLEAFLGFDPGPLTSNFEKNLSGPVTATPGEFFVVHYGKGSGGSAEKGFKHIVVVWGCY